MKKALLVVFCFFLAACGFQLRGQASLPFETLYLSFPEGHAIGADLRRLIKGGTNTRIVDKSKDAQAILEIISVTNNKQILSISGAGQVSQFDLFYRISFRLVDAKGAELIPTSEIVVMRIIPFTPGQVVGKEGEEAILVREMQSESAEQIMRRLEAVKVTKG